MSKKEILKKIREDWDEYSECHSCNWTHSFSECKDDITEQLEYAIKGKFDTIVIPCQGEAEDREFHRGLYVNIKEYIK